MFRNTRGTGDDESRDIALTTIRTYLTPWLKNNNEVRARALRISCNKFKVLCFLELMPVVGACGFAAALVDVAMRTDRLCEWRCSCFHVVSVVASVTAAF